MSKYPFEPNVGTTSETLDKIADSFAKAYCKLDPKEVENYKKHTENSSLDVTKPKHRWEYGWYLTIRDCNFLHAKDPLYIVCDILCQHSYIDRILPKPPELLRQLFIDKLDPSGCDAIGILLGRDNELVEVTKAIRWGLNYSYRYLQIYEFLTPPPISPGRVRPPKPSSPPGWIWDLFFDQNGYSKFEAEVSVVRITNQAIETKEKFKKLGGATTT